MRKIKALETYSIHNMEMPNITLPPIELQVTNNNGGFTSSSQDVSNLKLSILSI